MHGMQELKIIGLKNFFSHSGCYWELIAEYTRSVCTEYIS